MHRPRIREEARRWTPFALSASPLGSNSLLPGVRAAVGSGFAAFQYPQSDRIHCYAEGEMLADGERLLSVSPIGSNSLLRSTSSNPSSNRQSFSIPNRIEFTVTAEPTDVRCDNHTFQYPQSDRIHCYFTIAPRHSQQFYLSVSPIGSNSLLLESQRGRTRLGGGFQYPQSDRIHCYSHWRSKIMRRISSFSIPNRIEFTVTGSRRTQPRDQARLSVSPIGSNSLLPVDEVSIAGGVPTFQYPQSDRIHCYVGC